MTPEKITTPAIRRLARRGGAKRISGLSYEQTRGVLKMFLENVIKDTVTYSEHARRKSVTALEVVNTLRGRSRNLNIIARELAMLFGDSAFRPRIAQHLPGITNVVCDALSRIHQPSSGKSLPEFLKNITRTEVPERNHEYYLAGTPPG